MSAIKQECTTYSHAQLFKFACVGILNTAVGYGAFALLIFLDLHYIAAATLSHIIGMAHSYVWNKYFTFRAAHKNSQELNKFIAVYAGVYVLNMSLLWFFVDFLGYPPLIIQAFVVIAVAFISFVGQKYWVFSNHIHEKDNQTSL
ncbi:MAG: Membrane protein, GtrA family [Parcubacteria group bacterium GW2011_GWA2_47_8]|nr:MAG: Membrane protein, GtrA family [Parcubacteria group bacterium GW2011_GWA2_47_8]OHB20937.1 MAG: hypothetical protein A2666_00585 [Parcubacteria group bacterium RIFCSPHIGHO2_01_FULL_47_10b]